MKDFDRNLYPASASTTRAIDFYSLIVPNFCLLACASAFFAASELQRINN